MAWECFGIPQDELESVAERGRGASGIPWLVHFPCDLTFGNWKTTNRWMMTVYCISHYLCFHFLQRSKRSLDRNICNVLQNTKPVVYGQHGCTRASMEATNWNMLLYNAKDFCLCTDFATKDQAKVAKITLQISKLSTSKYCAVFGYLMHIHTHKSTIQTFFFPLSTSSPFSSPLHLLKVHFLFCSNICLWMPYIQHQITIYHRAHAKVWLFTCKTIQCDTPINITTFCRTRSVIRIHWVYHLSLPSPILSMLQGCVCEKSFCDVN